MTSLFLISLAAALSSDSLESPVSCNVANDRLTSVARQLEEQAGVKIEIQGAPERDWVSLRTKERPLREVLDALASLCDAEWKEHDNKVVFSAIWPGRDLDQKVRQEKIESWFIKKPVPAAVSSSQARKIIGQALDLQFSALPNRPWAESDLYNQTPFPRAIHRLLRLIGSKSLSSIKRGDSQVFTVRQRGRSEEMPSRASQVLLDLQSESKTFHDELTLKGLTYENTAARGSVPQAFWLYFGEAEPIDLWTLTVTNQQSALAVELKGYGGEYGVQRISSVLYVEPLGAADSPKEDGFAPLNKPFAFPSTWTAAAESDNLRSDLKSDKFDALTSHVHEAFSAAANELEKDYAAIIPDGGFLWATVQEEKVFPLSQVLRRIYRTEPSRLTIQNGFALIRPINLDSCRKSRIPRTPLARVIAELERTKQIALDDIAEVAAEGVWDEAYYDANAFIRMAVREPEVPYFEPALLRLYGGLGQGDRQRARGDGCILPYQNLSASQKRDLDSLLNSPSAGLQPEAVPDITKSTYGGHSIPSNVALNVPFKILPATPVLIRFQKVPTVYALSPNADVGVFQATPTSLAYAQVYMPDSYAQVTKFAPLEVGYLQAAVDFGSAGRFSRASSPWGAPGLAGPWLSYAELPEAFRNAHAKALQANRDQKRKAEQNSPPP